MKYWLLGPALFLATVFVAWPLGELFLLSLYHTDFITSEFVGLRNYLALATDQAFLQSAANSLAYVALLVPGQVGGALVISILCFDLNKRWIDFARAAFYIPVLSAGVIVAQSWRWFFSQRGFVNWILAQLGAAPVAFFAQASTGIPAISIVLSLSCMGTYIIIILAAMLSVDKSIIEAAQVDGASPLCIKLSIVVPAVWPQVAICCTLSAIAAPQIYETVNFLAPYDHTASMTFQIYNQAFRYSRHGLAAAMAVTLTAATAGLVYLKSRIERAEA